MPGKIFISYRRDDSAANAVGISQYLEQRFGRQNVFIDVDMRAGARFPEILERRLAACKVMLVLIGSGGSMHETIREDDASINLRIG